MIDNVFFFRHINAIGGIEAFFYYLARKYKDLDIVIYYLTADLEQVKRLRKYVRCEKYEGQRIKCKKAFFNFNLDIIDCIDAEEYIQIAHGDYKAMGIKPNTHKRLDTYLGVSEQVCKTYKEVTGYDTHLVYNPIVLDKPKKVLNLISATRLTKEKGKNRMIKLTKMLDKAGIPYLWTIFTDDVNAIDNPNVIYMKPRLDITNFVANADYLVQLSDNEGYCYSVIESLTLGTPVIVTDCPVFRELGVEHGINGFICDFELADLNIENVYYSDLKFEYKPRKDNWDKILVKGKSKYNPNEKVRVRATRAYDFNGIKDIELGFIPDEGYEFEVTYDRYLVLSGENKKKRKYVEKV